MKFQLCYYDCSCDDRTKRKIVLALVDAGKEKRSPELISGDLYPEMAPQVGLEPTTLRLTAECSAIELLRNIGGATTLDLALSTNGFYNKTP